MDPTPRKAEAPNAEDAEDAGETPRRTRSGHVIENRLATIVVEAAMRVHSALGPGLLESVYEACLVHELAKAGLRVIRQHPVAVRYDNLTLDAGYRLDLLVDGRLVVEVKSVDKILPIHAAQLLTYLRLGEYRLGLLLNFNVIHMRDGLKRVANGL